MVALCQNSLCLHCSYCLYWNAELACLCTVQYVCVLFFFVCVCVCFSVRMFEQVGFAKYFNRVWRLSAFDSACQMCSVLSSWLRPRSAASSG